MVSPSANRRAVKYSVEEGLGSSAAGCRALGLARSRHYRASTVSRKSIQMRKKIIALSEKHPRYGYRRITALMRRGKRQFNPKRVLKVCKRPSIRRLKELD